MFNLIQFELSLILQPMPVIPRQLIANCSFLLCDNLADGKTLILKCEKLRYNRPKNWV